MTIRRVVSFAAIAAFVSMASIAQGQFVVQWVSEPSTVSNPAGTHQLPSSAGCTLPGNALAPVPTCITQGQSYTLATMEVTLSGGSPGIAPTWAVSSGTLPPGLTIGAGPAFASPIVGTPTVAGVYTFTITGTVSSTPVGSIAYTMVVGPGTTPDLPTITQTALPTTATSQTAVPSTWYKAVATGGFPCVTSASINSGACPVNGTTPYYTWSFAGSTAGSSVNTDANTGLSINPTTGAITGTPLSGGTFPLTIQAKDGLGQSAVAWSTQVIIGGAASFTITTSSLPNGTVGTPYTATVSTQGGASSGITWSVVSGNLPPGVGNCTGSTVSCSFSGTPTIGGTYNFSLLASYTSGTTVNSNTVAYSVTINQASGNLSLPAPSPQSIGLSQAATMVFSATGGTAPYIYNTAPLFGSFPSGLSLTTSGAFIGTATVVGTYPFTVEVTDSAGAHASAATSITVGNPLSLLQPATQTVTSGNTAQLQFSASGGSSPYAYTITAVTLNGSSTSLPSGMSISSSTGLLTFATTGATSPGSYAVTVQVGDSASHATSASGSITVTGSSTLSMSAPAAVTVAAGLSATQQFTATGGTSPYTYTITGVTFNGGSITVPSGFSISSGLVTFATTAATAPGAYVVTVQAIDSASQTTTAQGSITVTAGALSINTPAAVTVLSGQSLTAIPFNGSGGSGSGYVYTLASGSLPTGVSLSGSGVVSGTPTSTGTFTFSVKVTDSASNTATSNPVSITVNAALSMPAPAPVTGVNNQTLTDQFTATGGTAPYTYSILSVTLNGSTITTPSQLTINSATGLLSFATNTATLSGPYVITVQAKDSASPQGVVTAQGTITVGPALTLANPPAILNGIVGQPITMQFTATGGTPPYTYAFQSGSLPPGNPAFTVNASTGVVSGTPTAQGSYGFIIQVTDSANPPLTATAQGTIILSNTSLSSSNVTINLAGLSGGFVAPNTQPAVTVTIAAPLAQDVLGTLGVSFTRTFDNAGSREVSFPNGQNITFRIPAGTTTAVFGTSASTQLKVGTAVGNGVIQASFQDSLGNNITPANLQPVLFSVNPVAPVINCTPKCGFTLSLPTAATGSTPGGTYNATIIGYSDTLGMSTVTFNFTPTTGTQLATSTVTVNVQAAFQAWYGNSGSNSTGGNFQLTIPLNFTVSGGSQSNPIAGATVTLTNSQGSVTSGTVIPQ